MKKIWDDYGMIIVSILIFVLFIVLACTMTGCTRYRDLAVPVYVHDTIYEVMNVHDSTYVDRWHAEYVKGDSIIIHDSVDRWRLIHEHDTVYEKYEVPIEVIPSSAIEEMQETRWTIIPKKCFLIETTIIVVLIVCMLWRIRKKIAKFINRK